MISELLLGNGIVALLFSNYLKVEKRSIITLCFAITSTVGFCQTIVWAEDFGSYADGVIVGTTNKWTITTTLDVNGIDPNDYFKVVNNQMELKDSNWKEQVFETEVIDISSNPNISLQVLVSEEGVFETYDYINVYYLLDTGSGFGVETPFSVNGLNSNDFDSRTVYQMGLNGDQLKIVIRLKNSADAEYFRFDDILVQSDDTIFYDNDSDGLLNNIDIDDDNDGIVDVNEGSGLVNIDADNDGILNSLDLDSDNDGIPDLIESGLVNLNSGSGLIDSSNTLTWKDDNADGLHDAVSLVYVALDTDIDLTPNYLDLDSDNDALFDIDESQAGNSNKFIDFKNGDADINGDGRADSIESELFRLKDDDGDGITELFGDGIQDIYEHTFNTYGNSGQMDPLNSDGNGLPDYANLDSDGDGVWDISNTIYASFDVNNDGIIDGILDSDGDGVLDIFDTDDTVFGSPRDLDRNLYINFDGRNDYIQDSNVLNNNTAASIMAWINIDTNFNTTGFIVGQDNFNLKLNASKKLEANVNGLSITYGTSLNTNQWIHVAVIFEGNSTEMKLYVNGAKTTSSNSAPSTIGVDTSPLTIAKKASSDTQFFEGAIDEVRIFDVALTELQLQKMVYQKIIENGNILGEIIPFGIGVSWSNLIRYYRMDAFKDDIIDDRAITENTIDEYSGAYSAKCYNIKSIKAETAPMPFVTTDIPSNLDLAIAVSQNNSVRGEDAIENDWSITHIKHDINLDENHSDLGLIVDMGVTVNLNNNTYLNNDWYLKLDGVIDLNGESQLVQTENSYLATNSSGYIERDQQGSANSFTYNYWSSPVSAINPLINHKEFYLKEVLFDGTIPNAVSRNISFGSNSDPYYSDMLTVGQIKLASYWLWRFMGSQANDYANWEWIGSGHESGSEKLNATEGFTMKGTSGMSSVTDLQNYVFVGKPNNAPKLKGLLGGDLVHTKFNGSFDSNGNPKVSLTGNPFPSAIDAHKFIDDNAGVINGQLYFWDHWGGNTHQWELYQGGYAIRNKAGGVAATSHPDLSEVVVGSKIPGQYIPVGQGFYVVQKNDYDSGSVTYSNPGLGDVVFKNSQRIFKTESNISESLFIKELNRKNKPKELFDEVYITTSDNIQRIRIGFKSSDRFFRPLMIAFIDGASNKLDYGYDAFTGDFLQNDALFFQENRYLVIQSFGEFDKKREIPFVVLVDEKGQNRVQSFSLESIENFNQKIDIYIKDTSNGETHEISKSSFKIELEEGEYKNRFSLVFQSRLDKLDEIAKIEDGVTICMNNSLRQINILKTAELDFEQVTLINTLGQLIKVWNQELNEREIQLPVDISTGVYIVHLKTRQGFISKKIIIE